MPSKKNIKSLEELKEKLSRSKTFVLADYKGLNVVQMTDLRRKLKGAGGELKVTKNTLLKLALKTYNLQPTTYNLFAGPTATVFAYEDEVAPLKVLYKFSQEAGIPKAKAGFWGKEFLAAERIIQIGQLPEKPVLQAQVVAGLNAPLYGLVNVLQGNLRKLVFVLSQLKAQK